MEDIKRIRPIWLEINLDNLASNYMELRKIVNEKAKFMAIIKGNAYAFGAVRIGKLYEKLGLDYLGVAILPEAIELRKAGIKTPILVLGYTPDEQMDLVVENEITQTIYTYTAALQLSNMAVKLKRTAKLHIKIDSGMGRLGFLTNEESIEEIVKISKLPNLNVEGIYTHFATADELDKTYVNTQFENFQWVLDKLKDRNLDFELRHVSNGPAMLGFSEYNLDMARCGIMLYGIFDSEFVNQDKVTLKGTVALKGRVANVKTVPAGTSISYGRTFETTVDTVIATIPIGYADGYPRKLSGGAGYACVNGRKAPIVGRICMDQLMIDVTDAGAVNIGDEVILISDEAENAPKWIEVAAEVGSIHAEILSNMSRRIPRVYMENGKIDSILNYLDL